MQAIDNNVTIEPQGGFEGPSSKGLSYLGGLIGGDAIGPPLPVNGGLGSNNKTVGWWCERREPSVPQQC